MQSQHAEGGTSGERPGSKADLTKEVSIIERPANNKNAEIVAVRVKATQAETRKSDAADAEKQRGQTEYQQHDKFMRHAAELEDDLMDQLRVDQCVNLTFEKAQVREEDDQERAGSIQDALDNHDERTILAALEKVKEMLGWTLQGAVYGCMQV